MKIELNEANISECVIYEFYIEVCYNKQTCENKIKMNMATTQEWGESRFVSGDGQKINEIRINEIKRRTGWKYEEIVLFSEFIICYYYLNKWNSTFLFL